MYFYPLVLGSIVNVSEQKCVTYLTKNIKTLFMQDLSVSLDNCHTKNLVSFYNLLKMNDILAKGLHIINFTYGKGRSYGILILV